MDPELSFIMTNLGQVTRGSYVLDPFVGTGSILLSCAVLGAYCQGSDIDIRVLRGKSSNQNIYANFVQFQLPRPELIRSEPALYDRHYRTATTVSTNSIVCSVSLASVNCSTSGCFSWNKMTMNQ
jgi:tRNA (guanine10-N2)-methyltransferase